MTTTNLGKALTAFLNIYIFTALLRRRFNMTRGQRSRQFLIALGQILSAAAGVVFAVWYSCNILHANLIRRQLGTIARSLGRADLSQYINIALNYLESRGFHLTADRDILNLNLFLLIAALVFKMIFKIITKAVWKKSELILLTAGRWYHYDEERGVFLLSDSCVDVRDTLHTLVILSGVFTAVLCAVTWTAGQDSVLWLEVWPAALLIVLISFENFLGGYTKEEYDEDIGGENSASERISSYFRLQKLLEDMFPGALLFSKTNDEFRGREGATNLIESMERSGDMQDRRIAEYYKDMKPSCGSLDVDMIRAVSDLCHGNSVIILNPFYRDLGDYLILPILNTLLEDRKVLVIAGRNSERDDIRKWMKEVLQNYTGAENLWRVGELGSRHLDAEVGVLSFSRLYDLDMYSANSEFFGKTGFVLLIEPSRLLAASETGLEMITAGLSPDLKPVFCAVDHDIDGLVDVLSHVLHTNIVNVVATPAARGICTAMGWSASGDFLRQKLFNKETHYLGNGMELAAVALKNQIPNVDWVSEEKAPVRDIRWIAGQYYQQICGYANLPLQQKTLDDHIRFESNLWNEKQTDNAFVIAEDEQNNLFATLRAYAMRGTEQSFVNVFSENYLLRDYMRLNGDLFMNDPKAVPAFAPHYIKTERNTVLRLIFMMASEPVDRDYIAHELTMMGIGQDEGVYKTMTALIRRYTRVENSVISVESCEKVSEDLIAVHLEKYSIPKKVFNESFPTTLRNAWFVVEDEKLHRDYIDARLFEHITQMVMPGQLVTYGGKLYKVKSVNPNIGCILQRASDSYDRRHYYRQVRAYTFREGADLVRSRRQQDIEISFEKRSFQVDTAGYLDMRDVNDLRTAKFVDLSQDPSIGLYSREISDKDVCCVRLPGTTAEERYTLVLLLGELFRTLFPYNWQYLAVLGKYPGDGNSEIEQMTYRLEGSYDENTIYIVEDSDMDLGLLEAVDENIGRIFEILCDYLSWHFEKMNEKEHADPPVEPIGTGKKPGEAGKTAGLMNFLSGLLAILLRRKKKPETSPAGEEKQPAEAESAGEEGQQEPAVESAGEKEQSESAEPEEKTGDSVSEDAESEKTEKITRYQKECFLKFGFDTMSDLLKLSEVREYLIARGYGDNALTTARTRDPLKEEEESRLATENICDFCGKPLNGVSYDRLSDGRIRCGECSATAINTVEEFRRLFYYTEAVMESVYSITFTAHVVVRTTDARGNAKNGGTIFIPSKDFAARALGFAMEKDGVRYLYIENGSPRLATLETMAHELTHIWQYTNWDLKAIRRTYAQSSRKLSRTAELLVMEGFAMWSSIQLLYEIGETTYARREEQNTLQREDEYGYGFRLYVDRFGIRRKEGIPDVTPFHSYPPLDPQLVASIAQNLIHPAAKHDRIHFS